MNRRKSPVFLALTLLTFCFFALGCGSGGGNSSSSGPPPQPLPSPSRETWRQNATGVKGQVGQRYTHTCPPDLQLGSAWVTSEGAYYTGSQICTAAVHAGIVTQAQGGPVTIEIVAPQYPYIPSERNGVTTNTLIFNDQARDNGTFVFVRQ